MGRHYKLAKVKPITGDGEHHAKNGTCRACGVLWGEYGEKAADGPYAGIVCKACALRPDVGLYVKNGTDHDDEVSAPVRIPHKRKSAVIEHFGIRILEDALL